MNFDSEFLLIAFGAVAVMYMLRYIMVAQALLGLVLQKPVSRLTDRNDCPKYLQDFFAGKEKEILELGFQYSHCHVTEDMEKKKYPERYYFVYYNAEKKTYASLTTSSQADTLIPCRIVFDTYFADGTKCVTLDGGQIGLELVDSLPNTVLQDNYFGSVMDQWELHLSYLERNPHLDIKVFPDSAEGFRERLDREEEIYRKYFEQLEQKGYIFKSKDGNYLIKTAASLKFTGAELKGMARQTALKKKKLTSAKKTGIPIEVEVENYQNALDTLNSKNKNKAGKFLFLAVTMAMFVVAFGLIFDFESALIMMAVIFIHECGHLLAMYLFGYKDLRMLFVPLFGAVAMGKAQNIASFKKIITYFAGPLPGIILAVLLVAVTPDILANNTLLLAVLALLILNYINLVPIYPLDGGQILSTILFSRTIWLQLFFLGFSFVTMLSLGIYLASPIMFIIAIWLLIPLRGNFLQRKVISDLQGKFGQDREIPEEELIVEAFSILKNHSTYKDYPFQRKFKVVQQVESTFNNVKASFKTVFFTLAVYIGLFAIPFLYILLPVLAGEPIPFLLPQRDPCVQVRALEAPDRVDMQSLDSRFERISPPNTEPDFLTNNTVFRYCFIKKSVLESGSMNSSHLAADFLSRLWTHYGEPDRIKNGFAYTIRDQETGVVITAYCKRLNALYVAEDIQEEGVLETLHIFETWLQQTSPADCLLEIYLDRSKREEGYEQYDEAVNKKRGGLSRIKLGAKDGKPFVKLVLKRN